MSDEALASFLDLPQAADEHRQISTHGDSVGEVSDLTLERRQVEVDGGAWIQPVRLEQLAHGDDHLVGQARRQDLPNALHHCLVDRFDPNAKVV